MTALASDAPPTRLALLRRRLRFDGLTLAALAVAALVMLPVLTIAAYLLQPLTGTWSHMVETVLPGYIRNTALLTLWVGIGTLLIGVSTAWLVTVCRFPGRGLFEWLLVLPLAMPAYVMAYTYTDFLQVTGPVQTALREATGLRPRDYWFPNIRSLEGAAAMLTLALYPYVYLLARTAFLQLSVCAVEASRALGCSGWASFRRVALPMARPAIAGGVALALMETLADFGTVAFFGVDTFTTGIYRAWFSFNDRAAAAQLSTALLGCVLLLILLERATRGGRRFHQASGRTRPLPGYPLRGFKAAAAVAVCALPLGLGFLLPGGLLLDMALSGGDAQFGARYVRLTLNSFSLAAVGATVAVLVALLVGYATRLRPGPLTSGAARIASMGYAVPGSVVAIGVLIPFAAFDNALDAWSRDTFGVSTGLLLTGGMAALIFAYVVRFLAISLQTVEAGFARVPRSMDHAARNLGAGQIGTAVRVHVPLLAGSLMTAGLIVFVDILKELPATMLMRPFNFDTLAAQAHQLAADERLREAATPALAIVATGLLPVLLLSRAIARSRPGLTGPD